MGIENFIKDGPHKQAIVRQVVSMFNKTLEFERKLFEQETKVPRVKPYTKQMHMRILERRIELANRCGVYAFEDLVQY